MNLSFRIALQFMRRKNSRKPSFSAVVSVIGVAFGVAALVVVITVLQSVQQQMKNILLSSNPNLIIYSMSTIPDAKKVESELIGEIEKANYKIDTSALFFYNEGIMSHKGRSAAVIIRAVEGEQSANAADFKKIIEPMAALTALNDENAVLANNLPTQLPKIILGKGLALKMSAEVGDEVALTLPRLGLEGENKTQQFELVGILSVGLNEYDEKLVLINFLDAAYLFERIGSATGIEMRLENPDEAVAIASLLNDKVPYGIRPWQHLDRRLFETIERDGGVIMLIVFLITFVAAFNIIATLSLGVIDRKRQIALLRSVGAPSSLIQSVFVTTGVVLGFLGAAVGVALAFIVLTIFSGWDLGELRAFYYLERLPVHYNFPLIGLIFIVAVLLSFLSSLIPAYNATKVSPLFGLKPGQK